MKSLNLTVLLLGMCIGSTSSLAFDGHMTLNQAAAYRLADNANANTEPDPESAKDVALSLLTADLEKVIYSDSWNQNEQITRQRACESFVRHTRYFVKHNVNGALGNYRFVITPEYVEVALNPADPKSCNYGIAEVLLQRMRQDNGIEIKSLY